MLLLCVRDLESVISGSHPLCIVQNSLRYKMWQISRMGRIHRWCDDSFGRAAGSDADAGCRALEAESGALREDDHDDLLYLDQRFEEAISVCKWDTRRWTFQDKMLSSRLLIFTESEVFFRCLAPKEAPVRQQPSEFLGGLQLCSQVEIASPSTHPPPMLTLQDTQHCRGILGSRLDQPGRRTEGSHWYSGYLLQNRWDIQHLHLGSTRCCV